MNGLEELLSNRWIVKSDNKEKYYQIKDNLEEIRRYTTEKLGCQLIANAHLIKLEKIPPQAESYMGILDFKDKREYGFLCMILMFLEDKETQEQFVLSQLTEYIAAHMPGERIDWTVYSTRKQLIRVMQFCMENQMILITDGDEDSFTMSESSEVLYENTGTSRYFMRSFTRDIQGYQCVRDFEQSDWVDVNEDRGIARRHRIYKRLLFSPGVYRLSEEDEDFLYLKNYRNRLEEDFENNMNCRLQVYKNSAYLIMNPGCHLAKPFPENNSLSDIVLLCNQHFIDKISRNEIVPNQAEMVILDQVAFEKEILECRKQYIGGLVKTYREKTSSEFVGAVQNYMEQIGMIKRDELLHQVILHPVMGKMVGHYPQDFDAQKNVSE